MIIRNVCVSTTPLQLHIYNVYMHKNNLSIGIHKHQMLTQTIEIWEVDWNELEKFIQTHSVSLDYDNTK